MSCYNYLLQVNVFSVSLVVLLAMLWHLINCSIVIIITNDFFICNADIWQNYTCYDGVLQLMIGFNRGVMVLWNLEASSVELTYVAATVSFMPGVISPDNVFFLLIKASHFTEQIVKIAQLHIIQGCVVFCVNSQVQFQMVTVHYCLIMNTYCGWFFAIVSWLFLWLFTHNIKHCTVSAAVELLIVTCVDRIQNHCHSVSMEMSSLVHIQMAVTLCGACQMLPDQNWTLSHLTVCLSVFFNVLSQVSYLFNIFHISK